LHDGPACLTFIFPCTTFPEPVTRFSAVLFAFALFAIPLTASPALAQQTEQDQQASSQQSDASGEDGCPVGDLSMADSESGSASSATGASGSAAASGAYAVPAASDTPAVAVAPQTDAEAAVQETLKSDGVHVVHFWAPWCPNAKNELDAGWASLVEQNPDVSFTFVSIWNDGASGASMLEEYGVPRDRVTTLQQPDLGPSDEEANRRKAFLGIPMTWSPSTWIFHNNGELAFAMNYGEMKMQTLQTLIDATQKDW
jgi:thiol-disulfide isomerase/thioredoxin